VLDVLGRPVLPPVRVAGGSTATLPLSRLKAGTYQVRVQGEHYSQVLRITAD
jgi:hypothetical protein